MLEAMVEERRDDGDLFDGGGAPLTDHRAEEMMIGFLLHKPGAVTETIDIIRAEDLHDPFHRRIYELLLTCYENDTPPTMETWNTGLGGDKIAGPLIARLLADADLKIDIGEVADHLFNIAERRVVGSADDVDFNRGAPFVSRFGAQRWEEIGTTVTGPLGYTWFVEDIFPMGEISLAFGDSGSGKSFDMFDMSMAGARGIMWNGRNVERGLVVYVAAEAGKGFAKRKVAYAMQHQLEPSDPLPFVLLTKRPNFFQDDTDCLALIEEITTIAKTYSLPLVCIVIDTLSALAPGMNENASQDVSMVRRRLVMLQERFPAAIVLVHHKPKNGSTPRGHGSLTADFETTVEFEVVHDKKAENGKVLHRGTVRKQREGKSGLYWEFTLPVIEVGQNKWGNPETSCVVQPYTVGAQRAKAVGFHATPTEMLFMRALYDAMVDHPLPPPANVAASITKVVSFRRVRDIMRARSIPAHEDDQKADGKFRTAFSRAGTKLRNGEVIGVQGDLVWPTGKAVNGFGGPPVDGG